MSTSSLHQADNTPREHKNQGILLWSEWAVAKGKARSICNEFFMVGHMHNIVDQRFSIVGTALREAPILQTPEEFLETITDKVKPGLGREVRTEMMLGVHDWKAFFAHLELHVGGLTSTFEGEETCHAWRVIRRSDLPTYTKSDDSTWEIEVPEETHTHTLPNTHTCVFLVV